MNLSDPTQDTATGDDACGTARRERAREHAGEQRTLLGRLAPLGRAEDDAPLEELDIEDATALVVGHAAQQAGDDATTQDGLLTAHRVDDLDGLAASLLGHAQLLHVVARDERIGHRLVQTAGA